MASKKKASKKKAQVRVEDLTGKDAEKVKGGKVQMQDFHFVMKGDKKQEGA